MHISSSFVLNHVVLGIFLPHFSKKNDADQNVKTASENQMKLKDDSKSTSKAFLMILSLYIFYVAGWRNGKIKKRSKTKNVPILPQKNVEAAFAKA